MKHRFDLNPVPASRPRVSRKGFSYYAEPYRSFKDSMREAAMRAQAVCLSGLLEASIRIYCTRPKTTKLLVPRPDTDNFAKAVMDGMNEVMYDDDSQIADLYVSKRWAPPGKSGWIEVSLEDLKL